MLMSDRLKGKNPLLLLALAAAAMLWPFAAQAAGAKGGGGLDWPTLTMELFGGLALFLYGMDQMGEALKMVAGEKMKMILAKLTTNRFMGLITGLVVTAIIQSSSVTTVMLVGFVTADLMTLSQAIGVILGADIGTTVTAQIVAFKVTKYASMLIAVGFTMIFASKQEKIKHYGNLIMGLGLIFFGMGVMSDSMKPLRSYEPFLDLMRTVETPILGILVSTVFTSIIQSSSATMGVVVALAMQGLISLEAGIALALGANIGTCATAGLAVIGKPREAVRVAVAHVTFKIAGVAIAMWFIPQLAELCRAISPAAADGVTGMDKMAFEVPRQVANAHTIFNVVMAASFLPFTPIFARFCEWVVPDAPEGEVAAGAYRPKFLDEALISTPALALSMVRREVGDMTDILEQMITQVPEAVYKGDLKKMEELRAMDDRVDAIYAAITAYLSKVGSQNLPAEMADEVLAAINASSEFESIGDIIETNLSHLAKVCAEGKIKLSDPVIQALNEYHKSVLSNFKTTAAAFISDNGQAAFQVITAKDAITNLDVQCRARQMTALQSGNVGDAMGDLNAYTLQMDIRDNLKRIYYHTKRVAKLVARTDDAMTWRANAKA